LKGTELHFWCLEREGGVILERAELRLGHLDDYFLQNALNSAHFILESALVLHLYRAFPDRFDDIERLFFLLQLHMVKLSTTVKARSLGKRLFLKTKTFILICVKFDGVIGSGRVGCVLFKCILEHGL
jgi:hypothetical protein